MKSEGQQQGIWGHSRQREESAAAPSAILIYMSEVLQLFVRLRSATTGELFAPPDLRAKIVEHVEAQESNLIDVVSEILADKYGVPYEPRGYRAHPSPTGDVLALRIPVDLRKALDGAAFANGRNAQDETIATLCAYYGLEFEQVRKRNGARRVRSAA